MVWHEVIVVGAGISGISAARHLADQGYDVVILEAKNRIGGRIHTGKNQALDFPIDLGASWIHGTDGNPIYDICRRHNIRTIPTDFSSGIIYDRSGSPVQKETEDKLWDLYYELEEYIEHARKLTTHDSLGSIIDKFVEKKNLDSYSRDIFYMISKFMIDQPFSTHSQNLSPLYFDVGGDYPGSHVIFPDGYMQLVDKLSHGLDIRLNHQVESIDYGKNSNKKVSIKTKYGKTFCCNYVILTLPLGVLKKGVVKFNPELPANKKKAIEKIGMGVFNKAYMIFNDVFWDKDVDWIHIRDGEFLYKFDFMNYFKYTGKPILCAFFSGKDAAILEQKSNTEISSLCTRMLQKVYRNYADAPVSSISTRWNSDNFSCGSYIYIPAGSDPSYLDFLAEPVSDNILFAGEATSKDYCTTVHGAYLSGIREAKRIEKQHSIHNAGQAT